MYILYCIITPYRTLYSVHFILYNYSLLYTVQCTFYIVLVGNGPLSGRRREIIFVPKKVINALAVYRLYLGALWFARPRTLWLIHKPNLLLRVEISEQNIKQIKELNQQGEGLQRTWEWNRHVRLLQFLSRNHLMQISKPTRSKYSPQPIMNFRKYAFRNE